MISYQNLSESENLKKDFQNQLSSFTEQNLLFENSGNNGWSSKLMNFQEFEKKRHGKKNSYEKFKKSNERTRNLRISKPKAKKLKNENS